VWSQQWHARPRPLIDAGTRASVLRGAQAAETLRPCVGTHSLTHRGSCDHCSFTGEILNCDCYPARWHRHLRHALLFTCSVSDKALNIYCICTVVRSGKGAAAGADTVALAACLPRMCKCCSGQRFKRCRSQWSSVVVSYGSCGEQLAVCVKAQHVLPRCYQLPAHLAGTWQAWWWPGAAALHASQKCHPHLLRPWPKCSSLHRPAA
jgi:hypothetical protein